MRNMECASALCRVCPLRLNRSMFGAMRDDGLAEPQTCVFELLEIAQCEFFVTLGHESQRLIHPFALLLFAGRENAAVANGVEQLIAGAIVCGGNAFLSSRTSIALLLRQT